MDPVEDFLKYLKIRNYSEHTQIHYKSDLKLFKEKTVKPWQEITKQDLSNFVVHQVENGFRPATINRRLYVIKGFYEYLREELDWKVRNPVRSSQFIRQGRPLPKILEDDTLKKLLKIITDPRDQAILSLMLRCGLRVGEVANLKIEDLNLFARELRFVGKGDKERVAPIPDEIFDLLKKCVKIRPKEAPKFFWNKKQPRKAVKINSIQRLVKRYAKKAGVGEVHCHLLRHTFARQMIENGVERTVLRDLMGHSNINSTDVYGKLSDPFIKESYFEAMDKILAQQNDKKSTDLLSTK